jgi:hypothetical protein
LIGFVPANLSGIGGQAAMLPHLACMPVVSWPEASLLFAQQCSAKLPGFRVETIGFWNGFPYEGD